MTTQVTFKGNEMHLQGTEVAVGQAAPDFELLNSGLEKVTMAHLKGKTILFNVVPSLDTGVCQIQSKRFFQSLGKRDDVQLVTVSMDLPFAQSRFCGSENIEMTTLSDHRDASFGKAYGLVLEPLRLLARSVIVVCPQGKIRHMEVVPEVTNEPNYDAAIAKVDEITKATV